MLMGMDMMGGFGWLGMGVMWFWALLPLALVTGAAWFVGRRASSGDQQRGDDAAATLAQRLAAGEIDIEQYESARAALGLPGGRPEGDSSG